MATYKGRFKPKNPQKYSGDPRNIVYRSSWELQFLNWCDQTSLVESYSSEEKVVPYYDPVQGKWRRYYPDFVIKYTNRNGKKLTEMVEIKPAKQVKGPNLQPKRKTQAWKREVETWATNQAKWKAALRFCEERGWGFKIITEKELSRYL